MNTAPKRKGDTSHKTSFLRLLLLLVCAMLLALTLIGFTSCSKEKECSEHVFGEWTVKMEATCTLPGSKMHTCQVCQRIETETIPVKEHNRTVVEAVPATCSQAGKTAYEVCKDCNKILTHPTEIPPTEHTIAYRVTLEPTCTQTGLRDAYCTTCQITLYTGEGISTVAHTPVIWEGEEPTCEKSGYTDGKRCGECNVILEDRTVLPALEHTIVIDPAVAAECERTGLTEGKHCSVCLTTIVEQVVTPERGHTPVIVEAGTPATCTQNGTTDHIVCSVCHNTLQVASTIEKTGHKEVTDYGHSATCTKEGLTDGTHCSTCGEVIVAQSILPKKEHEYFTRTGYAPTCTTDGLSDAVKCKYCSTYLMEAVVIPATGHTSHLTHKEEPTCTSYGCYTYTCITCGLQSQDHIPPIGHTVVIDPAREATTEQQGLTEGSHCSTCQTVLVKQTSTPRLVDYVVKVENDQMGSVNISSQVMAPGESITLVATPGVGYAFLGWFYVNGSCASEDLSVTLEAFDPDKSGSIFNEIEARFYPLVKLNVTQSHSEVVVSGAGYYDVGDKVTLSVTPTDHYRVEGWYVNGVRVSTADTYVYTMGEVEGTVEVRFDVAHRLEVSYNINGGKVQLFNNITADGYVFKGDQVLIVVTPNTSHQYQGIYNGETRLSANTSYYFTMPDTDVALEVRFTAKTFTLYLTSTENDVTLTGTGSYEAGVPVSITASEKPGYAFIGWLDASNGEILSSSITYDFEMEARNMTLYAQYEQIKYSVTAGTNYKEITVTVPEKEYVYGDKLTLKAPEVTGYQFLGWYIGGVLVSEDFTYETTVTSDIQASARYAKYYSVKASVNIEGIAEITAPTTAYVGQEITFTVTQSVAGYHFNGWFIGDTCISEELSFEALMADGNVTIEARFEKLYTITIVENFVGAGNYRAPETALAGEKVTVKLLSVNSGYEFLWWNIEDLSGTSNREFTFTMPAHDITVDLSYKKKVHVTISSNYDFFAANYNLPSYTGEAGYIEIVDILDASLSFDGFYVNGVLVETGLRYEFVAGEEDMEIFLKYTQYYHLNVWSESEGFHVHVENSMLPQGTITTIYADDPGEDYYFVGWFTGNRECLGTELSLTIEMPAEAFYIYAVYDRIWTFSVSTNAPSTLLITGDYRVNNGDISGTTDIAGILGAIGRAPKTFKNNKNSRTSR